MKNHKGIIIFILIGIIAAAFCSCEHPTALGDRLYLEGPTVTINPDAPVPRQPVDGRFFIKGTFSDKAGVDELLVTARYFKDNAEGTSDNMEFPVKWRYSGGKWEVNSGKNWAALQAVTLADGTTIKPEWKGDSKKASWTVPVDMLLAGKNIVDGQYQFTVSAVNTSGISDANSVKTRNVILYVYPPKVKIITPVPMPFGPALDDLFNVTTHEEPRNVGKYLNKDFTLRWQVEDKNDVWAIDIRLYEVDPADPSAFNPLTEANKDKYVYKMYINDVFANPSSITMDNMLLPNDSIVVPDLNAAKAYPYTGTTSRGNYEVKKRITDKTALQIVVRCINAAGLELEDSYKIQGNLIYWPQADIPWITLPEVMMASFPYSPLNNLYTVFPNPDAQYDVSGKAYDDDGVKEVEYSIYEYDGSGNPTTLVPGFANIKVTNKIISTDFDWGFKSPDTVGSFMVIAKVTDNTGETNERRAYYKTLDISWPEILAPTTPVSTNPLYLYINNPNAIPENWNFTIQGIASDSANISEIYMAWINPKSPNYAAMSQLAYLRDANYPAWLAAEAANLATNANSFYPDTNYAGVQFPNKVWRLNKVRNPEFPGGKNPSTGRYEFQYDITLNLKDHLNILPGNDLLGYEYLRSQVFVFKAIGTSAEKYSIIVWSPMGQEIAPTVSIDSVEINEAPLDENEREIDVINAGDKITINGSYKENSAIKLGVNNAVKNYLDIAISNAVIPKDGSLNTTYTITEPNTSTGIGTFTVTATVGGVNDAATYALRTGHLRDTLMINAELKNIGGYTGEDSVSWFVTSDHLRFQRIGSDTTPGTYGAGKVINFYLEFNEPVTLAPGITAANARLNLNSGGVANYVYNATPSNTQVFSYTVGATDSTENKSLYNDLLNITGLVDAGSFPINNTNYPLAWQSASGDTVKMAIRPTPGGALPNYTGGDPKTYVYELPSANSTTGSSEYKSSLPMLFQFLIDTIAPTLQPRDISISGRGGWYGLGSTIYLTAEFNENVVITSPATLTLNINNGGSTQLTTNPATVSGKTLTFTYTIKANDFTPNDYGDLQVIGFTGTVQDLAGNTYATNIGPGAPTPTSGYIIPRDNVISSDRKPAMVKAVPLQVPEFRVYNAGGSTPIPANKVRSSEETPNTGIDGGWDPLSYANSDAFNASYTLIEKIGKYYADQLWFYIMPKSAPHSSEKVRISLDYGKNWRDVVEPPNDGFGSMWVQRSVQGQYDITVRLEDLAGNVSPWSRPVTLDWDKGDLLEEITTKKISSGLYTTGDVIDIVVKFRRPVRFTTTPTITLNVGNTSTNETELTWYPPVEGASTGLVSSLTYNYEVGEFDHSHGNPINVTQISGFTAYDAAVGGNDVTSMINLTRVNDSTNPKNLVDMRFITIETGRPVILTPQSANNPTFTPGIINSSNVFVPGIKINDDDSVSGKITMKFDVPVGRGDNKYVTITQDPTGYRLPAVLTQAQYDLYKGIPNFPTYYIKGTNGYISSGSSGSADTTTKYILDFNVDTYSTTYYSNRTTKTVDATKTAELAALATALRTAEAVKILVNSLFVDIIDNEVTINLSGTNALKVPGAAYTMVFDNGFVINTIGNPWLPPSSYPITIATVGGVSRPAVRSFKPQETLQERTLTSTTGAYLPRFYYDRSALEKAEIRMDCRTPGSIVRYNTIVANSGTAIVVDNSGDNTANWDIGGASDKVADPNNVSPPTAPDVPGEIGNSFPTNGDVLEIGAGGDSNTTAASGGFSAIYQGFKYKVLAIGMTSGSVLGANADYANNSSAREEMLYRTVLTFKGGPNITADKGQLLGLGDTIWVRGEPVSGMTPAGYPLKPEDNFATLGATERAGVRLLTRVNTDASTTVGLNSSTYQWVTWDLTVSSYITIYMGHDDDDGLCTHTTGVHPTFGASTLATVQRLGPRFFAAGTNNWTGYMAYYVLHPGQHRWLNSDTPDATAGAGRIYPFTFVGSFDDRDK